MAGVDLRGGHVRGGTAVVLSELTCVFGATLALDGLSLDIGPGEFLALLGPSGCGKTTALRILAGFQEATSGRVLVDGRDVSSVPAQKRGMGMVFQSYSLFPNMTALDNVAFGLRLRKIGPCSHPGRQKPGRRYTNRLDRRAPFQRPLS